MSLGKSNSISAIYMQLQRWNNFYNNKVVFGRLNSNEKKLITDNKKADVPSAFVFLSTLISA